MSDSRNIKIAELESRIEQLNFEYKILAKLTYDYLCLGDIIMTKEELKTMCQEALNTQEESMRFNGYTDLQNKIKQLREAVEGGIINTKLLIECDYPTYVDNGVAIEDLEKALNYKILEE